MTTPEFDYSTATDNQILRHQAHQEADRIVNDLTALAERIRLTARQFDNESIPASAVVAEVVNAYTQGGNTIGAIFWSLIRELSRMK